MVCMTLALCERQFHSEREKDVQRDSRTRADRIVTKRGLRMSPLTILTSSKPFFIVFPCSRDRDRCAGWILGRLEI